GILKAGGGYAPLDLLAPTDRLALMLNDAKVDIVLTQTRMLARLPASGVRTICVDADPEVIGHRPSARVADSAGPSGLAYVMYTSGSTGGPNGVAVAPRDILRAGTETPSARV